MEGSTRGEVVVEPASSDGICVGSHLTLDLFEAPYQEHSRGRGSNPTQPLASGPRREGFGLFLSVGKHLQRRTPAIC